MRWIFCALGNHDLNIVGICTRCGTLVKDGAEVLPEIATLPSRRRDPQREAGRLWYESVSLPGDLMFDVGRRLRMRPSEVSAIREGRQPIPDEWPVKTKEGTTFAEWLTAAIDELRRLWPMMDRFGASTLILDHVRSETFGDPGVDWSLQAAKFIAREIVQDYAETGDLDE